MIDLQLVGYTADLKHLVFDLRSGTGEGRYRLLVDPDLFATLDTLRDARREVELPVGDPEEYEWGDDDWEDDEGDWDEEESAVEAEEVDDEADVRADDDVEDEDGWDDAWEDHAAEEDDLEGEDGLIDTSSGTEPAQGDWLDDDDDDLDAEWNLERATQSDGALDDEPGVWVDGAWEKAEDQDVSPDAVHVVASDADEPDREAEIRARAARPGLDARADGPALSPLEIQTLLRQGRSARSVAKAAGTTLEWVERWLGPIEAERDQVVAAARRLRLERARLGRSRDAMGAAVTRHLKEKGLAPNDVTWEAARRKDGRWRVSARYVHRRRATTASWLFDPVQGTLEASNDAGSQLGFTRRKQRA